MRDDELAIAAGAVLAGSVFFGLFKNRVLFEMFAINAAKGGSKYSPWAAHEPVSGASPSSMHRKKRAHYAQQQQGGGTHEAVDASLRSAGDAIALGGEGSGRAVVASVATNAVPLTIGTNDGSAFRLGQGALLPMSVFKIPSLGGAALLLRGIDVSDTFSPRVPHKAPAPRTGALAALCGSTQHYSPDLLPDGGSPSDSAWSLRASSGGIDHHVALSSAAAAASSSSEPCPLVQDSEHHIQLQAQRAHQLRRVAWVDALRVASENLATRGERSSDDIEAAIESLLFARHRRKAFDTFMRDRDVPLKPALYDALLRTFCADKDHVTAILDAMQSHGLYQSVMRSGERSPLAHSIFEALSIHNWEGALSAFHVHHFGGSGRGVGGGGGGFDVSGGGRAGRIARSTRAAASALVASASSSSSSSARSASGSSSVGGGGASASAAAALGSLTQQQQQHQQGLAVPVYSGLLAALVRRGMRREAMAMIQALQGMESEKDVATGLIRCLHLECDQRAAAPPPPPPAMVGSVAAPVERALQSKDESDAVAFTKAWLAERKSQRLVANSSSSAVVGGGGNNSIAPDDDAVPTAFDRARAKARLGPRSATLTSNLTSRWTLCLLSKGVRGHQHSVSCCRLSGSPFSRTTGSMSRAKRRTKSPPSLT